MKDERKTKAQLAEELADLRLQVADLKRRQARASAADAALRESEVRYRAVVEDQTDCIARFTPDLKVTFVNGAVCRTLCKSPDEILGHSFMRFVPPEDRETVKKRLETITPDAPVEIHENSVVMPSGEVRCYQWTNRGIYDDQGRLVEFQAVGRDITAHKQAEEALRESEARYRAVVESQTEMVVRFLPDCTLTFVNEAYCRYFGATREEMIGVNFLPLIPDEDRGEVVEHFASITPDSPVAEHEHRAVLPDGQVCWMHWTNRGVFDETGRLIEVQAVGRDVTDRKRAEEARRKAADELSLIIEGVAEHVLLHNPSMQIVWASRTSAKSVGASPEQLKGRHCYEVWQQRHTPCEGCPVQAALRTGKPQRGEMTTPDGRVWDVRGYPVYEDDNTLVGAVEVTLEITAHKRAEDALRESEANYRAIFDTMNDTLFVHDIETGDVVDFNPKASEVYGYRPEEIGLLNEQFHEGAEPPYSYEDQMRWLRRAAEGGPQMFEWLATDRSGRRFWVEVSLKRATIGGRDRLLAVLRDITERKRAEDALRKASEEKSLILSSVSEEVVYHDRDMGIVWANRAAGESAGLTPEQLVGRVCYEVWHGREQICEGCPVQKAMDTGAPAETETTTPDGRVWHVHGYPVFGDGGKVIGAVEVVRGITEQVRLEEELRQAQKMEAVGQLAGGIAHDFSNLMTGILCHAALLKVENPSPDDVREAATLIEGAAQRATELTSQLLGFARRGTRHDVAVDLNATVETSVRLLSRSLDSRIRVATRFCDEQALVLGDPIQMEQVVLNLAMNARDAMPDGGEMTFITQTLDFHAEDCDRRPGAKPGRYVVLSVEDTGCGMSEATRGRVFEPFFTTKPPGKGTGMGLAMVYGIAKDHGGWVELESEPGRGTAFRVFIPAAEPAADAEAPRP